MLKGRFDYARQCSLFTFFHRQKGIWYFLLMDYYCLGILITTETYLCDLIKNDVIFDKWAGTINVKGPPQINGFSSE